MRQQAAQQWRCQAAPQQELTAAAAAAAGRDGVPEADVQFLGVFGGRQTVQGIVELDAPADVVYATLLDYDSCTRIFGNISSTELLLLSDGRKQLVQACRWAFLSFKGTFNLHLAVQEEPASRVLVFTLIRSSFMRGFEGRWQVIPTGPQSCRVEHRLAVKPVLPIPGAVASITRPIFTQQVQNLMRDFAVDIQRQVAAGAGAKHTRQEVALVR